MSIWAKLQNAAATMLAWHLEPRCIRCMLVFPCCPTTTQPALLDACTCRACTFGSAQYNPSAHGVPHTHMPCSTFFMFTHTCTLTAIRPAVRIQGEHPLVPGSSPVPGGGPSLLLEPAGGGAKPEGVKHPNCSAHQNCIDFSTQH